MRIVINILLLAFQTESDLTDCEHVGQKREVQRSGPTNAIIAAYMRRSSHNPVRTAQRLRCIVWGDSVYLRSILMRPCLAYVSIRSVFHFEVILYTYVRFLYIPRLRIN